MKVKTITFMQTFPTGQFANQKLGMEIEVDNHLSELEIKHYFKDIQDKVEKAFVEMNPQINWNGSVFDRITNEQPKDEKIPYDMQVDGMLELIKMCNTKPLLERQKGQVERLNSIRVTEAFNNKLKSFE